MQVGQGLPEAASGRGRQATGSQDRVTQGLSPLGNILIALVFAVFLSRSVQFFIRTGSVVGLGLVSFNTIAVACLLTRRRQTALTPSIQNWILAPLAVFMPLLLRPMESASWASSVISSVGQCIGLAVMLASVAALNRSLGILAANRGIKTGGPYGWVRHPLYAGEIVFFTSFLIAHWNSLNALIVFTMILLQLVRSVQEEALLARDEQYVRYRAAVPYRLVPGVF
jgi:protein-S-isoprenylcysteine O-methyltransferase Ste14